MSEPIQMPSAAWSYNDVLHAYMLGSKSVPSVTDVMSFTGIDKDLTELPDFVKTRIKKKAVKGKRIHEATIEVDSGELDWGLLDQDESLYVLGYERAAKKYKFKVLQTEMPMVAVKEGIGPFGMKLDRLVEIETGDYRGTCILDVKTTFNKHLVEWGVQLAAYWFGVQQIRGSVLRLNDSAIARAVLWLRKEHEAELIMFGDPMEDLDVFFHGLAIVHWHLRRSGLSWMEIIKKVKK